MGRHIQEDSQHPTIKGTKENHGKDVRRPAPD